MTNLVIKTTSSIHDIDSETWDRLNAGRPFQSHRWYVYGESVMADCIPTYILVYEEDKLIARAAFWLIENEPLPIESKTIRRALQAYLRRHPLLICRSPLANLSGLILPENKANTCLRLITDEAKTVLKRLKGSFLLFDFMETEKEVWPEDFVPHEVSDPGTIMEITWESFEDYMASGNKKDRQHYKRVLRQASELDLKLTLHKEVQNIEEAMPLIRSVEQKHNSAENFWIRGMLENIKKIDASWYEVRQKERLVGCGLLCEDSGTLMATSLGLSGDVPFVYFLLVYATLHEGFEHQAKAIRMGSGAYKVKQRLGFELENNNFAVVWLNTPGLRKLLGR